MYCVMLTLLFSVRSSVARWRSTWHLRSRASPCGGKRRLLSRSMELGVGRAWVPDVVQHVYIIFPMPFSNEGEDVSLCVQMLSRSPTGISICRSHCFCYRIELFVRRYAHQTHGFFCVTYKRVFLAVAQPENHGDESGRGSVFRRSVRNDVFHSLFTHTRHRHELFFLCVAVSDVLFSWRGVEIEGRTAFDSVICVAIEGPQDQDHVSVHAIFLLCVTVFIFAPGRNPLLYGRQIAFQGQDVYLEHASSLLLDGHHHSHTVDFTVHLLRLTWYCSLLPFKLLRPRRGRVRSGMFSGCAVGHEDV